MNKESVRQLNKSRKAMEKTVSRMGGKIEWIIPAATVLDRRARRRNRTVKKWVTKRRAENAIRELESLRARVSEESRTMTKAESALFDRLMTHVNAAIQSGEKIKVIGF